jgi:UDP-N-acetylmuramate dehydrogenase
MTIKTNFSLKKYNTFGIDTYADFFVSASNILQIQEALCFKNKHNLPLLVLGGGSNILLTKPFNGLVLHIDFKGKEIIEETENLVLVAAKAGENWHEFVLWCVKNDFGGVENLSLIPGNVGTGPIQNIGAYGVEIKDTIESVKYIEIETGEEFLLTNLECKFGYRESIFKKELLGKIIITEVNYRLTKTTHQLKLTYGNITQELDSQKIVNPTISDVSQIVTKIRQSKLPNPENTGNAGSFFKNPIISNDDFLVLKKTFPEMMGFSDTNGIKLFAGWLIEKAGWKGKRFADAGVHQTQSLVLVNYGNATGQEILDLSEQIKTDVFSQFGVNLETEVNVV